MNRRSFLSGLGALIGGISIDQAVPLGRVWSFPREVKCLNAADPMLTAEGLLRGYHYDHIVMDDLVGTSELSRLAVEYYSKQSLDDLFRNMVLDKYSTRIRRMPRNEGKQIQLYRANLSA